MSVASESKVGFPKGRVAAGRSEVIAPASCPANMSLFDYVMACQPAKLDETVIAIVLAQTKVPHDIRDDAAQEIRLAWSLLKPDTARYKPGQIIAYAHRTATHTALRLRRELGSSVRLPGSAFRKRKDGSSYVTPGMLAMPLDWNEIESWFDSDVRSEESEYRQTASPMPDLSPMTVTENEEPLPDQEDETRRLRLDALEQNARSLSRRQYRVMAHLVAGDSLDTIEASVSLKRGLVLREIDIAATIIGPHVFNQATPRAAG